jgi:DNA invertase Pin-like site-specific DNA recombinase
MNPRKKRGPKRPAVYTRISLADRLPDGSLDTAGIERQHQDCTGYCDREGWAFTLYAENNRSASAYAKKKRTEFDRMLAAVRNGDHDVIVVAELSRYTREPRIVEDLIDLASAGGVELVSVRGGAYDLTTAEGKMRIRNEAVFAAGYSDFISDKVKRKQQQLRENGLSTGASRAFGYKGPDKATGRRGGMEIEPAEAKAIKKAVAEVLAGATLSSVARSWNEAGLTTPRRGTPWDVTGVHIVLTNPRHAGLLAVQCGRTGINVDYEILGEAAWPAIVSRKDHDAIVRMLTAPDRRKRQPARRTLLTGFVRCECGATMVSNGDGYIRCKKPAGKDACGHNGIPAADLESLIVAAVLRELDKAKTWKAIDAKSRAQQRANKIDGEDPDDVRAELDALADAVGEGLYSVEEGVRIRKGLAARLERAQASSAVAASTRPLEPFRKGNVAVLWDKLDVDRRRAVLGAIMESVTVLRRPDDEKHARGLWDPDRLQPEWIF